MQRADPNLRVSQYVWLINTPRGSLQGRCRGREEGRREKEEGGKREGGKEKEEKGKCDHQCIIPKDLSEPCTSFSPEFLPPSS